MKEKKENGDFWKKVVQVSRYKNSKLRLKIDISFVTARARINSKGN